MRIIIIDDEQQSHDSLRHHLGQSGSGVEVVASGYSVQQGMELLRQHKPDLIFLDVELPDGTGFQLLEKMGKPSCYVVFITAHNRYAETAFRFGALDFLTKPIDPDLLEETLVKAKERYEQKFTIEQLQIALETFYNAQEKKLPQRIAVSTNKGLELLRVEEIAYLEAQQNYTDFHLLTQGKKRSVMASLTLKTYEQHLEQYDEFLKIHRSHIINLLMVDQYIKGEHCVVLRDGSQVAVAKGFKDILEQKLAAL
jgi:two-component system, LytTR family, response regulator